MGDGEGDGEGDHGIGGEGTGKVAGNRIIGSIPPIGGRFWALASEEDSTDE